MGSFLFSGLMIRPTPLVILSIEFNCLFLSTAPVERGDSDMK